MSVARLVGFDELKLNFEKYVHSRPTICTKTDLSQINSQTSSLFDRGFLIHTYYKSLHTFYRHLYPHLPHSPRPPSSSDSPNSDLRKSRNYWNSDENCKWYLEDLARWRPHIKVHLDWLQLDTVILKECEGGAMLKRASLLDLLKALFPEFFWERIWKFPSGSEGARRRVFLDHLLAASFRFVATQSDLREIDCKDLTEHPRGVTVLAAHQHRLSLVFSENYPELNTEISESYSPNRVDVDRLLVQLEGERVCTRWQLEKLSQREIADHPGGASLMTVAGSMEALLGGCYPELRVGGEMKGLRESDLVFQAMDYFDIGKKEDWYRISMNRFSKIYGRPFSTPTMLQLLKASHPEESWNYQLFSKRINKRSSQRYLGIRLKEILKKEVMFEDYVYKSPEGRWVVFDFYVPGKGLVIEYQGEQHYRDVFVWKPCKEQRKLDEEKRELCEQNGLKILHVPFWWNETTLQHLFQQVVNE
eukprot:TRINITY_DN11138_c0_g1_i2.p1 TRINITY_DN11138_c0_g1~~TRINITY_DN11138_c0_g1_i2.p1  ORF type:complete len:475 (-),score=83.32 TRINITY_DN11138_c0_g1_i2:145-1569(-)